MKKIGNFVSNCSRYMVQQFVLEVLMSSFERYPFWKITISSWYLSPEGGGWSPLLKQKLYIDWKCLFQRKILNFTMIGFHQIALSTLIRNFSKTIRLLLAPWVLFKNRNEVFRRFVQKISSSQTQKQTN